MKNSKIFFRTSMIAAALALATSQGYAAEQPLSDQVEALNQRIAQLEAQAAPSQFKNSQVSLYGSIRPTLIYSDADTGNSWDVGDAISQVGIKGSTEFADGWQAIVKAEWAVDVANSGNFGKGRQTYVAIASPYGQLAIGKQRPAQYSLIAEYVDIFNNAHSPFAYDREGAFFVDNFVTYKLETGSFTWMAGAQFNGDKGDTGADLVNIGVGYDTSALHLGLSYLTQDNLENGQVNGDNQTLGGVVAYTFDNGLYLAASYQDKQYNFDNQIQHGDRSGSTLDTALAYPLSNGYKIKLGYFQFKDGIEDISSLDYDGFNTTLEWNPLSNVRVHLEYLNKNYDNLGDDSAIAVGFRYDFNLNWKG
ncbi:porin [Shewanella alkalitolerans]|uniref:porin n=1 Tax=Shewanella alkalitolerans TaxID=2864209 RepID=UPI001C65DC85|nr:porin [Shewanella alkalitolerans]QYJ97909.1 porin [Shewanella alkalitolerans]